MKILSLQAVRYIAVLLAIGAFLFRYSDASAGSPIASPNINGVIYVDGVTYTTIPAALAALGTNGGIVMVPPGSYSINSTIANHANNVLLERALRIRYFCVSYVCNRYGSGRVELYGRCVRRENGME